MSVDCPSASAINDKQNEITQLVLSRKRKLIQLYTVASSADALSALRPQLDAEQSPALKLFLHDNDIQQGRYFQDATLPPRYQFSAKPFQTQSPPFLQTTHPSPISQTSPSRPDATQQQESAADCQTAGPSTVGTPHASGNAPNQVSIPQDQTRKAAPETDRSRTVMHFSGVVVDGSHTTSRQRSPRLTLQPESCPPRSTSLNPSRPVSPPYSPGTEPTRGEPLLANNDVGSASSEGPINVLTPRRDNLDGMDPARVAAQHGDFETADGYLLADRADFTHQAQRFRSPANYLTGDNTPVTPSDALRSTFLAKTTGESSITSIEEDVSHLRDVSALPPPVPRERSVAKVKTSDAVVPDPAVPSLEVNRQAPEEPRTDPVSKAAEVNVPSLGSIKQSLSKTVEVEKDAVVTHDAFISQKIPGRAGKHVRTSSPEAESDVDAPVNIDQARPTSGAILSIPTPQPRNKNRVRKLRSKRGVRHMQVVLSKPVEEQYLETVRMLRKEQVFKQSGSQSYLKPLIAHQVLNMENFKSMDQLLTATSKTVTTSDFMASIREEQDLRVLERTKQLQSSLRWSLRQPKPSIEPPQPRSHWDVVLANVKWLRIDYKEEAKFRAMVAKTLAEWCAEYHEADEMARRAMTVKVRQPNLLPGSSSSLDFTATKNAESKSSSVKPATGADWLSGDSGINYFAALPGELARYSLKDLQFGKDFLENFPIYEPQKQFRPVSDVILRAKIEQADAEGGTIRVHDRKLIAEEGQESDEFAEEQEGPLPPENTSCALFDPESRPLRARLTAPWVFKPPTAPMPPQTFYEHRSASQWNWEDDQLLKQYTKDFPSNWPLISDRMMPKSSFTTYIDRRSPWECYERLLAMEGPPADAQARQYLRHFSYRLERARESFDKHQNAIREAAEQHAQNAGQPAPNLPQKRFPTPMRVDRKPNKRFLAMLDCARKLARKREQTAAKQQSQAQPDGQAHKAAPPRALQNQTPQYFSRKKYEAEVKEQERVQSLRDQQRAILEAQRRPQGSQQAHLTNGIGQQMRQRVASGQPNPAGQLPVTGNPQAQARQIPPQINPPIPLSNGLNAANAQLPLSARPQANMQGQQRIAPLITGSSTVNAEAMRMVQQMHQQQRNYQLSQQQPNVQNQFARMSPSVAGANGLTSASMLAAFSNGGNSYPMSTLGLGDGVSTPSLPQQLASGTAPRVSPHITQSAAFQTPGQPQQLSSGHVTAINNLEHQIRNQHPNMSPQDVRHLATVQLKQAMTSMQRQNAINGALSAATGAHAQGQQTLPIMRTGGGGAHSPFPLPPQQPVSTPQISQGQQQQPQQQQHSPYQANGMLSTPSTLAHTSARGHSPVNLPANMAGSPQLAPQQSQSGYSAQLRQQMYAQQQQQAQRQHQLNLSAAASNMAATSGSPAATHASPALPMAMPMNVNVNPFVSAGAGLNRTPSAQSLGSLGSGMMGGGGLQPPGSSGAQGQGQGQGGASQSMRPPSRSASAMGVDATAAAQFQQQLQAIQQRVAPSPTPGARPVSSGGFGGQ